MQRSESGVLRKRRVATPDQREKEEGALTSNETPAAIWRVNGYDWASGVVMSPMTCKGPMASTSDRVVSPEGP